MLSLQLLRVYPLLNMRSNTTWNSVNHFKLSCLNSAAIWRAPSTCGQTGKRGRSGIPDTNVHEAFPVDLTKLEELNLRTKAISAFNCQWQKIHWIVSCCCCELTTSYIYERPVIHTIIIRSNRSWPTQNRFLFSKIGTHGGASLTNTSTGSLGLPPPINSP